MDVQKLIQLAIDYQTHSYAPYSHYNVAAAVLMDTGKIYCGANIENASYPAGTCAEHNAVNMAIADNKQARIVALALVGGPDYTIADYCAPCGICRQVIREFCQPRETKVIMAKSLTDYKIMSLEELLPLSFGPSDLQR